MGKKSDTEIMNDFNLKYSKLTFSDFLLKIGDNYKDSKFTHIFKEILNGKDFKNWPLEQLISMKASIKQFKAEKTCLKNELTVKLKQIQAEIDNHYSQ